MKSKCLVCSSKEAVYKCPTCYLPFCSVACGKAHKKAPCQRQQQQNHLPRNREAIENDRPADHEESLDGESVLLPHQLGVLDGHEEIQRKIRDERLMSILEGIDKAPSRAKALEKEMRNPEFLEFCDDVLEALQMKECRALP